MGFLGPFDCCFPCVCRAIRQYNELLPKAIHLEPRGLRHATSISPLDTPRPSSG
ncbi:predicted protein [Histoplasma mississippiense (nom. inval.)]|uniref:predicted protein n=1 Tax=Ajellomyces capsulatus (strain NAm1 / WU24) TaxID=2059318 RepID=UPI000157C0E2|nr:predicted protein [Histoplasma mississippiense (nom. inval.)]EDN07120.1 predicted protein [Histoplasma mississippiense (nom. inval.)]